VFQFAQSFLNILCHGKQVSRGDKLTLNRGSYRWICFVRPPGAFHRPRSSEDKFGGAPTAYRAELFEIQKVMVLCVLAIDYLLIH
jgi:hypothetical protein